jgi:hypothetical protein
MSKSVFLIFLLLSAVAAAAQTDQNTWAVTGRVATIAETTYPDGNKITAVTLGSIVQESDGAFSRYIPFNCSIYTDCRTVILGSCTKQTITATLSGPEGTTTTKTTSCLNQHYADCWTFSGYLTPVLWATSQTQSYGCNF